jgi:hypothetical protein
MSNAPNTPHERTIICTERAQVEAYSILETRSTDQCMLLKASIVYGSYQNVNGLTSESKKMVFLASNISESIFMPEETEKEVANKQPTDIYVKPGMLITLTSNQIHSSLCNGQRAKVISINSDGQSVTILPLDSSNSGKLYQQMVIRKSEEDYVFSKFNKSYVARITQFCFQTVQAITASSVIGLNFHAPVFLDITKSMSLGCGYVMISRGSSPKLIAANYPFDLSFDFKCPKIGLKFERAVNCFLEENESNSCIIDCNYFEYFNSEFRVKNI